MSRSWRKWLLVIPMAIALGYLLNVYGGNPPKGFVSPTVFAKEIWGQKNNSDFSPFGLLFRRGGKPGVISPASSLSLVPPDLKKVGTVLGQSVSSQNGSAAGNTGVNSTPTPSVSISTTTDPSPSTSSTNSSSSNTTSTSEASKASSLTTTEQAVQDVTNVVLGYLKSANYTAMYNLMSVDFKNTFSLEDFVASFSSASVSTGSIVADPKIFGANNEWAEQSVKLVLANATSQNYLNIYHLENGAWTLYATQDQ